MSGGRQKGTIKTGGRKKGTLNKPDRELHKLLGSLKFEPFEFLAKVGRGDKFPQDVWNEKTQKFVEKKIPAPIFLRVHAAAKLLPYLRPQRRAIDISGDLRITNVTPAEELALNQGSDPKIIEGHSETVN